MVIRVFLAKRILLVQGELLGQMLVLHRSGVLPQSLHSLEVLLRTAVLFGEQVVLTRLFGGEGKHLDVLDLLFHLVERVELLVKSVLFL